MTAPAPASAATTATASATTPAPGRPPRLRRALGLLAVIAGLAVTSLASFMVGANPLPLDAVWSGLWRPDGSEASIIVHTLRIPRTVVGILVGAAFGVSGAVIQALTRNPLADPGILGVNAGAGFAVTLGVGLLGIFGITGYIWLAFLGAAGATVLVFMIGSAGRGSASPVTLVLAGVALGAVLTGFSTFLTLIDPDTFDALRNWGVGSIARTGLADTMQVVPFLMGGLLLALLLSGSLNAIALGDDLAAALGTSILRTRVLGVLAVTLLAGAGTALTGGIGFIGLMVPHVVRWIVGPDQRWIIAYSALTAPVIVLAADVLGRVLGRPG